jgi:hypothetical protein
MLCGSWDCNDVQVSRGIGRGSGNNSLVSFQEIEVVNHDVVLIDLCTLAEPEV